MLDSNWELASGDVAHTIEVLNYSNQVNVIEALVRLLMQHHPVGDSGCEGCPTLSVVKEFHRTATLFLLERPGQYRGAGEDVSVYKDGLVVHQPPPHPDFEAALDQFHDELLKGWATFDHVGVAAFTLWFVNWVHPFKNGNGRTARAFSYACLSLKMGIVIPGSPTVIDLIMDQREEYEASLSEADKGYAESQRPNLGRLETFIEALLIQQLSSIDVE